MIIYQQPKRDWISQIKTNLYDKLPFCYSRNAREKPDYVTERHSLNGRLRHFTCGVRHYT